MKIIYLGTPEFAVLPLESIIKSGKHEVVAVVTQTDKPVGRKAVLTPPPVKTCALKYGIKVLQYESLKRDGVDELRSLGADAMVTCAYGQILSREILDICKFGVYNIHASLLPKYRGAAPIQFAIINGEEKTGITIMRTDVGLDTGDILTSREIAILPDETYGELSERLSETASSMIVGALDEIENGTASFKKQDDAFSSVVKTLKKEDSIIDFTKNSQCVANFVNGMNPWPVARSSFGGKTIKIYRASTALSEVVLSPGTVAEDRGRLIVACGEGTAVEIKEIQEEGGRKMSARDYLLGRKLKIGDVLGQC